MFLEPRRARWISAMGAAFCLTIFVPPASAHETATAGSLTLTLGWRNEPAYAGQMNAVELKASGAAGAPISDPAASLSVQILFGEAAVTKPMRPDGEEGLFSAPLIPTRAGEYSFHVTGTIQGEQVDLTSACSKQTFDCVIDSSEIEFPVSDPTGADVAKRLDRQGSRISDAQGDAGGAKGFAIAALALSVVALASGSSRRRSKAGKDR